MRADLPRRTLLLSLALLCLGASGAAAAAHDNIVEFGGLSHITWQDRVPSCPDTKTNPFCASRGTD